MPTGGRNCGVALPLDFFAKAAYPASMSTDARSTARRYYNGSGRCLEADMAALAANPQGVVIFLPRLVAFLKPVDFSCPQHWLALAHSPQEANAWYVHLLVGDLAWACRIGRSLPALHWLCFQRGARNASLHRVSWARFLRFSLSHNH